MKFLILLFLASPSFASYVGKLDLGQDPSALAMRDLQNGVWRVGLQYPVWHLQNTRRDSEVFHVSVFWASRLEGQTKLYGPSLGFNVGQAASLFISNVELLATAGEKSGLSLPPWALKIGDWTSLDIYGGYAPIIGGGDKPWAYGVGGKVRIPFSSLYQWASGTQSQGTGIKGL